MCFWTSSWAEASYRLWCWDLRTCHRLRRLRWCLEKKTTPLPALDLKIHVRYLNPSCGLYKSLQSSAKDMPMVYDLAAEKQKRQEILTTLTENNPESLLDLIWDHLFFPSRALLARQSFSSLFPARPIRWKLTRSHIHQACFPRPQFIGPWIGHYCFMVEDL